jgi:hypothetical protein
MQSPCCLYVCEHPLNNFRNPEPVFMKLGLCVMAPEPILTTYFIIPPISLCVCMCIPSIVARQRLRKLHPSFRF